MEEAALNVVGSVAVAVLSAFVTVQLSIRRFRSERRWERKATAYESIFETLHKGKAFNEAHLKAAERDLEVSEEEDKALREVAKAAAKEVYKAIDIGGYILSKKAIDRLMRYKKEEEAAGETQMWQEYLVADLAATTSCLKDLIQIAKEDLKISN